MKEEALAKLDREYAEGKYDRYAEVMKEGVRDALKLFVRQDEEFAQAVVQGGSFSDCMRAVAKDCGRGISDLIAYKRAVEFYFPGADVEFKMRVLVNPQEKDNPGGGITLNFRDFF